MGNRINETISALSCGIIHPPLGARILLRKIMDGIPGLSIDWTSRVEDLRKLTDKGFDGVLLYIHRQDISDTSLKALDYFSARGGGILALHSATASFKTRQAYSDILSGRFSGHGPVNSFTVHPKGRGRFRDLGAFTVRDELYHHDISGDIDILYTAKDGSGEYPRNK